MPLKNTPIAQKVLHAGKEKTRLALSETGL
jgi:hypothetical protein